MAGHAQLKFVMTECPKTQIRLTGLYFDLERRKQLKRMDYKKYFVNVPWQVYPSLHFGFFNGTMDMFWCELKINPVTRNKCLAVLGKPRHLPNFTRD